MSLPTASRQRPRQQPVDQAHGLRQLFGSRSPCWVPLVHNAQVGFGGVVMERLCTAFAAEQRQTLVVDAADSASPPHELAQVDLASCVETLSPQVQYLAARGLPAQYLDARATMAGFLQALGRAAPLADLMLVHAGAADLRRMFVRRRPRPVLMVGLHTDSLTAAYAAMKLLALRLGPLTFDAIVVGDMSARRARATAERLASCADHFLGAALGHWAVVDPAAPPRAQVGDDLRRLAAAQCRHGQADDEEHTASHGPAAAGLSVHEPRAASRGRLN